jgi:hypothetical protein
MRARRDEQKQVREIMQRWLDGTETTYPGFRALRDLAELLKLERRIAPSAKPKRRGRRALSG